MIEALVAYFEERGFFVDVLPGTLIVGKYVRGELLSFCWCIPRQDLTPTWKEYLFGIADRYIWQCEQAIREKFGVR